MNIFQIVKVMYKPVGKTIWVPIPALPTASSKLEKKIHY